MTNSVVCAKCGKEIHEFLTGRKNIEGRPYCNDCYFEEFGNVLEKNPIGVKHKLTRPHP